MYLDSPEALGVLNTLFETVAPSSLRPVDMLLKSMFTVPATMVREASDSLTYWYNERLTFRHCSICG